LQRCKHISGVQHAAEIGGAATATAPGAENKIPALELREPVLDVALAATNILKVGETRTCASHLEGVHVNLLALVAGQAQHDLLGGLGLQECSTAFDSPRRGQWLR